jgi:hypothetical protein
VEQGTTGASNKSHVIPVLFLRFTVDGERVVVVPSADCFILVIIAQPCTQKLIRGTSQSKKLWIQNDITTRWCLLVF